MKKLERDEMKNLKGGQNEAGCSASLDCGNGATVSCTGSSTCTVCYASNGAATGVNCGTGGSASCSS